jgi:catalase
MPAPEASEQVADHDPSPALSQIGQTWPVAGRVVGIIADSSSDLAQVEAARKALDDEGMVPLVIAPTGGALSSDGLSVTVQRTFLTARSTEFDALLVAAGRQPAPDATAGRDAKAGEPGEGADPRVALMLSEAYRHAKAIGFWGSGSAVLDAAGIPQDAAGIAAGDSAAAVTSAVSGLLASHRAWERFPATGAAGQEN